MDYELIGGGEDIDISDIKKKEPLLFSRFGNKNDDLKYIVPYLPDNIKTVVEVFGGSFALIRRVYFDNKYKKIVNDTDPDLQKIYKNPEMILKIRDDMYKLKTYQEVKNYIDNYDFSATMKHNLIRHFVYFGKTRQDENYPINRKIFKDQIKFMKSIKFINKDYTKILNDKKFLNDEHCLLFLDPPYVESHNQQYNTEININEIIYNIYNLFLDNTIKCKVMLVINKKPIIIKLFKKFIKGSYRKIYQTTKKKETLLIITNY